MTRRKITHTSLYSAVTTYGRPLITGRPAKPPTTGREDWHTQTSQMYKILLLLLTRKFSFFLNRGKEPLDSTKLYNKMTKDGQEEKKLSYRHTHARFLSPILWREEILTWRADRTWIPNSTHTQLVCWLLPHWFACCPFQKDRPPRPFSYRNEFFSPFVFTSITKATRKRQNANRVFITFFSLVWRPPRNRFLTFHSSSSFWKCFFVAAAA